MKKLIISGLLLGIILLGVAGCSQGAKNENVYPVTPAPGYTVTTHGPSTNGPVPITTTFAVPRQRKVRPGFLGG